MYIKTRVVTVVFRLSISALSAFASWLLFHIFGNEAWRLFSTWVMLAAAVYYFCLALLPAFSRRRDSGRVFCPTLQGAIVISGMTLAIFRLVFNMVGLRVAGLEGIGMILVNFVLPTMCLFDWVVFTKKGRWRTVDPFYWLALLVCYGAWILLSAEFMNSDATLRYPYAFLDFNVIGIDLMLTWFAVIAVVVLALSYICVVLDFAMSGNLAKYVVLPHIKTIVVEEEVEALIEVAETKVMKNEGESAPVKSAQNGKSGVKTVEPKKAPIKGNAKAQSAKRGSDVSTKTAPNSPTVTKSKPKPKSKSKSSKRPIALLEAETRTSRTAKTTKKKTEK